MLLKSASFKILATFCLLCAIALVAGSSSAEDIFIAQESQGNDNGFDASNARSIKWFNEASSWGEGSGKISRGDQIYLVGTIIDGLWIQGDGVTINFTPNSRITMPAGRGQAISNPLLANYLIYCCNRNDITIDGHGTGIIECTQNGSELKYQALVKMIQSDSCSNLTVRGLIFQNGYVHSLRSDAALDEGKQAGIKTARALGTYTIENCLFSNVCWAISISASGSDITTLNVISNYFINYDHGVAIGSGTDQPLNIRVAKNTFDTTANWDTESNRYHHDGIHYYGKPENSKVFVISHNTFKGDWGINNTAHVFLETGPNNVLAYNNVFIQSPGNKLNNGFFNYLASGGQLYNNTFLGSGDVANSIGISISGTNMSLINNIFSGVTTFISSMSSAGVSFRAISNNIYANQVANGNTPWRLNLTNYNVISEWQKAAHETNSYLSPVTILDINARPKASSLPIGRGADLSHIFTDDASSSIRHLPWDIGALTAPKSIFPPVDLQVR